MDENTLRRVRAKLEQALAANRDDEAIALLEELSAAEPSNARWPHKHGDLMRKQRRLDDAVDSYATAVDLYAAAGYQSRAAAMAKTVLSLDPKRIDVLERVDPIAAQQLRRQSRAVTTSLRGPQAPQATAVPTSAKRHPPIVEQSAPVAPARPSVPTAQGFRHPMVLDDDAPSPHPPPRSQKPKRRIDPRVETVPLARSLHPGQANTNPPAAPAASAVPAAPAAPAGPTLHGWSRQPAPAPSSVIQIEDDSPSPIAPAQSVPEPAIDEDEPIIIIEDEPTPSSMPAAAAEPTVSTEQSGPGAPAKEVIALDRLSLPPRFSHANWELSPAELPARPTRAIDLAPPPIPAEARSLDWELPLAESSPLTAAAASSAPPAPAESEPASEAPSQTRRVTLSPVAAAEILDAGELFSRALEEAAQLLTAPDSAPDERRLGSPVDSDPGLSESELSTHDDGGSAPGDEPVVFSVDALSTLPEFPLFAGLDPEAVSEMIAGSDLVELLDGAYVVRRGELSDTLFGIVEGGVTVSGADRSYQLSLGEGDVFGESCLLKYEPRHADVRVKGRLCALRIPRRALFQLLHRQPELADRMLELLTRRLLGSFLLSSSLFHELTGEGRRALARLFEIRFVPAGTAFAAFGKPMDHVCIALTGQLTVVRPGFVPIVAPAGYMFGHQTLFSNGLSQSTVTARVNMVVLRLPAVAVTQLALQYPTIRAHLAALSSADVVRVNL
jgi:CRP-like cAMP-binding protein